MRIRLAIVLAGLCVVTAVAATGAGAAPGGLQATFVNVYSQCPTTPPTLVFCGPGTVVGFGAAYSTAHLTGPPAPIPGTDCEAIHAIRTITLADGDTLTLDEAGTLCPPSGYSGQNGQGGPYTVAKTYTIVGGTGVFAGASGTGSDVNRSAGNSQVSVISGTLDLG
jgi:hypothetical protein